MNLRYIKPWLLNLVYPNRCPFCGKFIEFNKYICEECKNNIIIKNSDKCPKCGFKYKNCICSKGTNWDYTYAICNYNSETSKAIFKFKNSVNTNFAIYSGMLLGEKIINNLSSVKADYIIPVPMRLKKKLNRGYNQAEIIAQGIRYTTGTPILKNALRKNPHEKDLVQHELSAEKRFLNANKIFLTGKDISKIAGKNIILCDDVLTTGATMNKCSEILKNNGAAYITIAVTAATKSKKHIEKI